MAPKKSEKDGKKKEA
jgi:hypothetical protein